jgi:glutathione synthase/RimK-type ligase-like ATP-grasp enzyme
MKICIVTPKTSREALTIKSEAESSGHECKRIYISDIYFEVNNNIFQVNHRKIELLDFDAFIFRSVENTLWQARLLAEYLLKNGKVIVDESLATERWTAPLAFYKLAENSIPQINTVFTMGLKTARDVLMDIEHPILIKSNYDSTKHVTMSEDWTDSYDMVRTTKQKQFEFQGFIDTDHYFKIYVIGDKVIGGLQKTIAKGELGLNDAKKVKSSAISVNQEMSDLAVRATKALKLEVSTVDIVTDGEKSYVIGIQRAPAFLKFSKLSGINFAKEILDYIENKVNQRN